MRKIIANNIHSIIELGFRGENEAEQVIFPFAEDFRNKYGEGVVQLLHRRNGDEHEYPCSITVEGDDIIWTIQTADVAKAGTGKCQLVYFVDEVIAKKMEFTTNVWNAMGEAGETPAPYQSWVQDVLQAGSDAQTAAEKAESEKELAEIAREDAEDFAAQAEEQANYAKGIMGLAEFNLNVDDGNLYVTYPTPYYGALFLINEHGYLEVIVNA